MSRLLDLLVADHDRWTVEKARHVNGPGGVCLECARDGLGGSAPDCPGLGVIQQQLVTSAMGVHVVRGRLAKTTTTPPPEGDGVIV